MDGLVYENWKEEAFDIDEVRSRPDIISAFGLDFGYTNDPSTLFCGLLDQKAKQLFVFDEMYEKGLSNKKIADTIKEMGYGHQCGTPSRYPASITSCTAARWSAW